jgi:hypothetical protein
MRNHGTLRSTTVRVADGRTVEHWNCVDRLGLLAQLGVLPQAVTGAAT